MENTLFQDESRREFLKRVTFFAIASSSSVVVSSSCQAQTSHRQRPSTRVVGGACEGCESIYEAMPQQLSWQTEIATASEPGERLEMSGIVYQADGKTPAPNVILYVYHTDATGHYTPTPNATGWIRRHGHLRGWMKTNASGEYKFATIKPAPYPSRDSPAHIHPIIKEPDKNEYYIDEYVFDDDPLLTREKRSQLENRGGSGIVRLSRNSSGVWAGGRNMILGLNIPHYR
jgi:protocatechuate 3,4-dioxygenase beta subunit